MKNIFFIILFVSFFSCKEKSSTDKVAEQIVKKEFVWEGANIYFLLTDRFNNGNTKNDTTLNQLSDVTQRMVASSAEVDTTLCPMAPS